MDALLGIDVGTSNIKAALYALDGRLLRMESQSYPTLRDDEGAIEQNPEAWWEGMVSTVRALTAACPEARVLALALSTQGGTLVPLDRGLRPLHPAVVWSDRRALRVRERLLQTLSEAQVHALTGWKLGQGLNLLQILRLKEEKPEIFAQSAYFASVPDYLSYRLCGRLALDYSNAGINQLLDLKAKCWSEVLMTAIDIDAARLAELLPAGQVLGTLSAEAAEALALSREVRVVVGGHDQYCAALGAGVIRPGDVLIGTGTAWAVTTVKDEGPGDAPGDWMYSRHVVDDKWGAMISLSFGCAALDWFRRLLESSALSRERFDYRKMDACIEARDTRDELLFLPFFNGVDEEGLQCLQLGASFTGIRSSHDAFDFCRAIMESVSLYAAKTVRSLVEASALQRVTMAGGAANSRLWAQMTADALDRPLIVAKNSHTACAGAAILAGLGAGVYADTASALAGFAAQNSETLAPGPRRLYMAEKMENFRDTLRRLAAH